MIAGDIISYDLPALHLKDNLSVAFQWLDDFKVSHLPVIDDENHYLGLISENSLFDLEETAETIADCEGALRDVFIGGNDHIFNVVKAISSNKVTIVPVINYDDRTFLGSISNEHLMQVLAAMPSVENPGGIIVLEVAHRDYSLSEIARIVESNDAKILTTLVTSFPDSNKMEVTIKLNTEDVQSILQAFERYQYTITASYDKSSKGDDLVDRYNQLMNYLNMG